MGLGLAWALLAAASGAAPPLIGAADGLAPADSAPTSAGPVAQASGNALRPTLLLQLDVTGFGGAGDGSEGTVLPDGVHGNVRRVRFGVEGDIASSLRYAVSYEFGGAAGEARTSGKLNSAWLGWRARPGIEARIGIFSAPGGLEGSSTDLWFLERAAPASVRRNIVGNSSRPAIGLFANGERWTISVVGNGDSIYADVARGQQTLSARATVVPFETSGALVHLGVVATIVPRTRIARGEGEVAAIRFSERGELRTDERRLVDTGEIISGNALGASAEFGAQWGRWLLQAEHMRFTVDRGPAGLPDADLDGWYVQLGRILHGGARRYSRRNGSFAAPVYPPPGQSAGSRGGVWEAAARYSFIDLDHRRGRTGEAALPDALRGGRQRVFSLVLNWYASPALRFQAMAQRIDIDRLSPGGSQIGGRINTASLRTQYAF